MFKKIITLLSILTLGTLTYATTLPQEVQDEMKEVQKIFLGSMPKNTRKHLLSALVTEKMEEYYLQNNFHDPNQKTGWYRVDRFLKWVKKNEQKIQDSSFKFGLGDGNLTEYSVKKLARKIYKGSDIPVQLKEAFWIYLGARYVEDIYNGNLDNVDLDFSDFAIVSDKYMPPLSSEAIAKGFPQNKYPYNVIHVDARNRFTIPQAINVGLHESTHLIPMLKKEGGIVVLTELATFYSQYNFGLPVKKEEITSFAYTTRDIRRLSASRPELIFVNEYNYFIAGIILNKQLTPQQVLKLKERKDTIQIFKSENTIKEMIYGYLAAKRDTFMIKENFNDHVINVTEETLPEKAKLFNINEQVAMNLLPFSSVYIGDFVWPNTNLPKESIVLQRQGNHWIFKGNLHKANEEQLLQLVFGEIGNNPKLQEFYDRLISYLPIEIIQMVLQLYPVVESDFSNLFVTGFDGLEIYWQEAILRALNDVTTDNMPVPEGYL